MPPLAPEPLEPRSLPSLPPALSSVAAALVGSAEYSSHPAPGIVVDYAAFLDRAPEPGVVAFWEGRPNAAAEILAAPEAWDHAGESATGWLDLAYRGLFGRSPDPVGEAYWTAALAGFPEPVAAVPYLPVAGLLFAPGGPQPGDIEQGAEGDCVLLASAARLTTSDRPALASMFTRAPFGWVVHFYAAGTPVSIYVDQSLPAGGAYYDHPVHGILWAAMLEKAYADFAGIDQAAAGTPGHTAAYDSLNGDSPDLVLTALTGRPTFGAVISAGPPAALAVLESGFVQDPRIVVGHAYAVLREAGGVYTIFNPWGPAAPQAGVPETLTVDLAFLEANFEWVVWQ